MLHINPHPAGSPQKDVRTQASQQEEADRRHLGESHGREAGREGGERRRRRPKGTLRRRRVQEKVLQVLVFILGLGRQRGRKGAAVDSLVQAQAAAPGAGEGKRPSRKETHPRLRGERLQQHVHGRRVRQRHVFGEVNQEVGGTSGVTRRQSVDEQRPLVAPRARGSGEEVLRSQRGSQATSNERQGGHARPHPSKRPRRQGGRDLPRLLF